MTYTAKLKLEYHSTFVNTYSGAGCDDCLPEENITMEIPAEDLSTLQLFKFFSNFLRSIGHTEHSIMKGACNTAFNEMNSEKDMKEVAKEYELTMNEDLREKFELWKEAEEETARLKRGPMGTVINKESLGNDASFWAMMLRGKNGIEGLKRNAEQKIKKLEEEVKKYHCDKVTRLEVIDNSGRSYSNRNVTGIRFSFQDDDRTLKLFVD